MYSEHEIEKAFSDTLCFDLDEQRMIERTEAQINHELNVFNEVLKDEQRTDF